MVPSEPGGPAHRPGHVREDLIPRKLDGTDGAASRPAQSHRLFQRRASAHGCCQDLGRWLIGNDSLFNRRSANLRCRIHGGRKRRISKVWRSSERLAEVLRDSSRQKFDFVRRAGEIAEVKIVPDAGINPGL